MTPADVGMPAASTDTIYTPALLREIVADDSILAVHPFSIVTLLNGIAEFVATAILVE